MPGRERERLTLPICSIQQCQLLLLSFFLKTASWSILTYYRPSRNGLSVISVVRSLHKPRVAPLPKLVTSVSHITYGDEKVAERFFALPTFAFALLTPCYLVCIGSGRMAHVCKTHAFPHRLAGPWAGSCVWLARHPVTPFLRPPHYKSWQRARDFIRHPAWPQGGAVCGARTRVTVMAFVCR